MPSAALIQHTIYAMPHAVSDAQLGIWASLANVYPVSKHFKSWIEYLAVFLLTSQSLMQLIESVFEHLASP